MPTLNVRLSEADARLARRLRESGRSVSEIVRAALRAEARRADDAAGRNPAAVLAEMKQRFPMGTKGAQRVAVDATDRRQVQAAVRKKLGRR